MSFKQKLFIYFTTIFTVFTLLVMIFQYDREKKYRIGQLENTLDNITEIAQNYMVSNAIVDSGSYYLMRQYLPWRTTWNGPKSGNRWYPAPAPISGNRPPRDTVITIMPSSIQIIS